MGWFERQTERILAGTQPAVIDARAEFGVPYLFHSLASASASAIWITLEEGDDAVAIGNKLSRAVRHVYGATLFGAGMPFSYGLNYIVGLTEELGPLALLVDEAHHRPDFCAAAVLAAERSQNRMKVVLAGYGDEQSWLEFVRDHGPPVMTEEDLAVTPDEARALMTSSGVQVGDALDEHVRDAHGAYEEILFRVRASRCVRPSFEVELRRGPPASGPTIESLQRAGKWRAAFEAAVRRQSAVALDVLDRAADQYFAQGELLQFLHFVSKLLEAYPSHPHVLYWWFQVHAGLGTQHEVEDRIASYLDSYESEAPHLSAAYASVVRPADALARAERAVASSRSPETLAALGFLRAVNGDLASGIQLLKEAFDGFRAARRHHKVIQLSNSIGSAYVQLGEYRRALVWAQTSLEELRRRDIREELLRLSSVNLVAYTQLLIGDVEAGEEQLKRIRLSVDSNMPPTLEGLVSTFGDYALVCGSVAEALGYYERLYRRFAAYLPGYSARYYVRGLLHAGRLDAAKAVVTVAEEMLAAMDATERTNLRVASTLVQAMTNDKPDPALADILGDPVVQSDAVMRAELILAVVGLKWRTGATRDASQLVRDNKDVLAGLGRSGWRLLSPPGTDVDALMRHVGADVGSSTRLTVLGTRALDQGGLARDISLRHAELITILAMAGNGLSGEALLLEMYGERGRLSTLKATVSRARRLVSIESLPYRLSEAIYVDVLHLDDLLSTGHVREALELYKGPLLPESEAPGIRRARERIDEAVRQAVLHAGEADLALRLARKFPDDLELWEKAKELTAKDDPAYPLIRARIRRIRGEWGL